MKLLLVEQDPAVCEMLRYALQVEGHEVQIAIDWVEASSILSTPHELGGILGNVVLPQAARQTEAMEAAQAGPLPVLLMTGDTDTMLDFDARAIPYLDKPFRVDRVLDWIHAKASGPA